MKKGKTIINLLLVLCINMMLFAAASGTAFAVNYDKEISPNGNARGNITLEDRTDIYKVKLAQSGILKVDISSKITNMSFRMMDESGDLVDGTTIDFIKEGNTAKDNYLAAGTYYLEFKHVIGTGQYSFNLTFTSAGKTNDGIDNSTIEKVRQESAVKLGSKIKGFIAQNKKDDMYKVVLSQSGRLTLKVNSAVKTINYSLYDDNDKRLDGTTIYEGTNKFYHDLAAGTYYLMFSRGGLRTSGYGMFSASTSFIPAKETYKYKNETINLVRAKAAVPLSKTVRGQIALNDDSDVYKYKIPKKGKYALRITSKIGSVYVELKDSKDNHVTSFEHNIGTKTYILDLKKGTYYLCYSKARTSPRTGVYTSRLRPASVSIRSLTPAAKSFKVRWKKGTGNGYEIQYSTSKTFKKNVKTVRITKASTTSKTIKKLKKGTRYYVRIRSYAISNGKPYASVWSTTKSVKVK